MSESNNPTFIASTYVNLAKNSFLAGERNKWMRTIFIVLWNRKVSALPEGRSNTPGLQQVDWVATSRLALRAVIHLHQQHLGLTFAHPGCSLRLCSHQVEIHCMFINNRNIVKPHFNLSTSAQNKLHCYNDIYSIMLFVHLFYCFLFLFGFWWVF